MRKGTRLIEVKGGYVFEVVSSGWTVAYRLALMEGRLVLADMTLTPEGRGGITAALLRTIPVGEHRRLLLSELARATSADISGGGEIALSSALFEKRDPLSPTHPKHRRRGDRWYAELASLYAALIAGGATQPVPVIAERLGLAPATVTAAVRDARAKGYLTATKPGRAGGRLTAKARRLLAQEPIEED